MKGSVGQLVCLSLSVSPSLCLEHAGFVGRGHPVLTGSREPVTLGSRARARRRDGKTGLRASPPRGLFFRCVFSRVFLAEQPPGSWTDSWTCLWGRGWDSSRAISVSFGDGSAPIFVRFIWVTSLLLSCRALCVFQIQVPYQICGLHVCLPVCGLSFSFQTVSFEVQLTSFFFNHSCFVCHTPEISA